MGNWVWSGCGFCFDTEFVRVIKGLGGGGFFLILVVSFFDREVDIAASV